MGELVGEKRSLGLRREVGLPLREWSLSSVSTSGRMGTGVHLWESGQIGIDCCQGSLHNIVAAFMSSTKVNVSLVESINMIVLMEKPCCLLSRDFG